MRFVLAAGYVVLSFAVPAIAETSKMPVVEEIECTVCAARHQRLKKLQPVQSKTKEDTSDHAETEKSAPSAETKEATLE